MFKKFFSKPERSDLIEAKAQKMASNLLNDINLFTESEQAVIIKRVEHILLQRFSSMYDEAYNSQQRILEAKEKLK